MILRAEKPLLLCSTEPGGNHTANVGRGKKAKNKHEQRSQFAAVAHAEASEAKSDQGDYDLPSADMRYISHVAFCLCSRSSARMLAATLLYKPQQSSKLLLQEHRCCCAKLSDPLEVFVLLLACKALCPRLIAVSAVRNSMRTSLAIWV